MRRHRRNARRAAPSRRHIVTESAADRSRVVPTLLRVLESIVGPDDFELYMRLVAIELAEHIEGSSPSAYGTGLANSAVLKRIVTSIKAAVGGAYNLSKDESDGFVVTIDEPPFDLDDRYSRADTVLISNLVGYLTAQRAGYARIGIPREQVAVHPGFFRLEINPTTCSWSDFDAREFVRRAGF